MLHLQPIFSLNQHTLSCIRSQDFCGAMESASAALRIHHGFASNGHDQEFQNKHNALDMCMLMSKGTKACNADIVPLSFVYNEGIEIPFETRDSSLISIILIFNAALAHQLVAMSVNSEASFRCLHKAKQLYALVCNLQEDDHNFLFQIAVHNNVAMIDQSLGNIESATMRLENIT